MPQQTFIFIPSDGHAYGYRTYGRYCARKRRESPVLLDRVRNIAYNTRMVASSKEERQTRKWGFMETAELLCRRIGHSIVCTRYWGSWDEKK